MLGKLLNGLVEKAVDRWLASESAKRYVSSAILRWGQVGMLALLAYFGARELGLTEDQMKAINGHWKPILEILAPLIAAWAIERASLLRAKLNAKALEVAVEAPSNTLTPQMAKEVAKVSLYSPKA